ncbi:MAG: integrase/recombinase XerD [Methanofollis sp.]|nr:integrase/recombinase XerD [Methanofollis sp.]
MENERFHHPPEEYFALADHSINNALAGGRISQADADLIREYADERSSHLSAGRYFKTVSILVTVRKYFSQDFAETKKADLFRAVREMKHGKKDNGSPYKANTIADHVKFAKRFFAWLAKNGYAEIDRDAIAEIGTPRYDMKTKADGDILTAEEITAIIEQAKTAKYKALIGVLYEGGFRISEVASMEWKDVTFTEWGAKLRTDGKTGKLRTVPIITYASYLAAWRAAYPGDATGDNFVFLTTGRNPLQYRGVSKAIHNFVKAAGITKRVTLHSFRHSRITHALRGGMQETLAKKAFWGNQSTNMIETYSHLVDEDVDDAFAALAGVDLGRTHENEAPEPIQCPQCHFVNAPGIRWCGRCGIALTEEAVVEVDGISAEVRKLMVNDPALLIEAARVLQQGMDAAKKTTDRSPGAA